MINDFRGEYYFLSNFYNAPITYKKLTYLNNEAAFQSMKVFDLDTRKMFCNIQPNQAKKLGRKVELRRDWESTKDQYMFEICRNKFTQNPDLAKRLIDTGDAELIEGNTWNDTYWGVCNNRGQNKLGKILMQIREYLKQFYW